MESLNVTSSFSRFFTNCPFLIHLTFDCLRLTYQLIALTLTFWASTNRIVIISLKKTSSPAILISLTKMTKTAVSEFRVTPTNEITVDT